MLGVIKEKVHVDRFPSLIIPDYTAMSAYLVFIITHGL
jgi:hypothetical protein